MRNSRIVAIVVAVMNVILLVICAVFYIRTDRKAPEFKFQISGITYTKDMDRSELLADITAHDNRDGDITERIVIEKIVENKQESSVVVFYAASDKAGNVAKISRVFPANLPAEEDGTPEKTDVDSAAAAEGKEEGDRSAEAAAMENAEDNPDNSGDETAGESSDGDEENGVETEEGSTNDEEDDADAEDGVDAEDDDADGEDNDTDREDADADEEENSPDEARNDTDVQAAAARNERTDNRNVKEAERPVITLKTGEVTTRPGVAPAWVEVIGSLEDDKDSYETLFYNLSVSKYDLNNAGTYKVALTTKDSDGNVSEPVTLTIHVK